MTVSPLLGTVAQLGVALKVTLEEDDPYAVMMLAQASQAVRDFAKQPKWVRSTDNEALPEGYIEAPATAKDITLWVAQRAYTDPRNRSRRTSGPISESFFENGVYGLGLTDDEKARLGDLAPSEGWGGLYAVKLAGDPRTSPVILADSRAGSDPLLYADPAWSWAFTPRAAL
jgi:hypothetical protein